MDKKIIEKFVKIKPLDILKNPKGDIFKIINRHDKFYSKFGELYLTTIKENLIKRLTCKIQSVDYLTIDIVRVF